jgi:predicted CXXCH cytochrome family protein
MNRTLLTLSALLACLFISTVILSADHQCADCHVSAVHNTDDLKKPLSALCVDCHAARISAGEHKVDIAVSILGKTPGNTLPLQAGKLTCITCHDPHKVSLALRLPANELCQQCHKK